MRFVFAILVVVVTVVVLARVPFPGDWRVPSVSGAATKPKDVAVQEAPTVKYSVTRECAGGGVFGGTKCTQTTKVQP